jgi:putative oxidoreductase
MTHASVVGGAVPAIGRILISAIFLVSVAGKLAAPAATVGFIASAHLPFPQIGYAVAVFVELFGGVALALGFRTRIAAGGLAAFCIAAALAFHSNLGDQNQFFHFFKNIAMTGGLLQVVAFGAGRYSLDARRRPTKPASVLQ